MLAGLQLNQEAEDMISLLRLMVVLLGLFALLTGCGAAPVNPAQKPAVVRMPATIQSYNQSVTDGIVAYAREHHIEALLQMVSPEKIGQIMDISPDKTKVLYQTAIYNGDGQMVFDTKAFLADLSAKSLVNLNDVTGNKSRLANFSPDGANIAVSSYVPNEVSVVRMDGRKLLMSVPFPTDETVDRMTWSLDGEKLGFLLIINESNKLAWAKMPTQPQPTKTKPNYVPDTERAFESMRWSGGELIGVQSEGKISNQAFGNLPQIGYDIMLRMPYTSGSARTTNGYGDHSPVAIDFATGRAARALPVIASSGGTVMNSAYSFSESGCDLSFANKANYVALEHPAPNNQRYSSAYLHLEFQSGSLTMGNSVNMGTRVGTVGNTGWSCGIGDTAHIHFQVNKTTNWWSTSSQALPEPMDDVTDFQSNSGPYTSSNSEGGVNPPPPCNPNCPPPPGPLAPPNLLSPGNGSSPGPEIANTTPTFTWQAVAGAGKYGLYVRNLNTNQLVVQQENIAANATSWSPAAGVLAAGNNFRWNMITFKPDGSDGGNFSGVFYFRTPTGGTPPPTGTTTQFLKTPSLALNFRNYNQLGNAWLYNSNPGDNEQVFDLIRNGGWWMFRRTGTNDCLNTYMPSNDADLFGYDCNSNDADQQWDLNYRVADGAWYLANRGYCVDAPNWSNNARVHMWGCINGVQNQMWQMSLRLPAKFQTNVGGVTSAATVGATPPNQTVTISNTGHTLAGALVGGQASFTISPNGSGFNFSTNAPTNRLDRGIDQINPSTTITVSFDACTTAGTFDRSFTITGSDSPPVTVNVTKQCNAAPKPIWSPSVSGMTLPAGVVGGTTSSATFTLSNTGSTGTYSLSFSNHPTFIAAPGSAVINGGASTVITVNAVACTVAGTQSGTLTIDGGGAPNATVNVSRSCNPVGSIGNGTGLLAQFWNTEDFTGPRAAYLNVPMVNFDWGSGSPTAGVNVDNFSGRFSGQIQPKYTGEWTFTTDADDGMRLWINNQLLVDRWVLSGLGNPSTGKITLTAGQKYDIRFEMFERTFGAGAILKWSHASQPVEVIPTTQLYPTTPVPMPQWGINPASITLPAGIVGDGTRPSSQFTLSNSGSVAATYGITTTNINFGLSSAPSFVNANSNIPITVTAPACTVAGPQNMTLNFSSAGANTASITISRACNTSLPIWTPNVTNGTLPAGTVGGTTSSATFSLANTGTVTGNYSIASNNAAMSTSPTSGSLTNGNSTTITVTAVACTAVGTQSATFTISGSGAAATTVNLSRSCSAALLPTWTPTPTALTLPAGLVGGTTSSANFSLANTGTASGNYAIASNNAAISTSPSSGTIASNTASTITTTAAACTTVGTQSAVLTISGGAASNATVNVSRVCTAAPKPIWTANPTSLTIPGGTVGGSSNSTNFTLSNTGNAAGSYTIASDNPAISATPNNTNLGNGSATTITVAATACTTVGTRNATLTISGGGADAAATVAVSQVCSGIVAWSANPSSLSLTAGAVGGTSASASFTLTNTGSIAGSFSATSNNTAITVSPSSGSLNPSASTSIGLSAAVCANTSSQNATITIQGNGASTSVSVSRLCNPQPIANWSANPTSLTLSAGNVGGSATSAGFNLSNTGTASGSYSISSNNAAISATPSSGSLNASASSSITVSAAACASQGTQSATLTISGSGANTTTVSVSRTCNGTVTPPPNTPPSLTLVMSTIGRVFLSWPEVAGATHYIFKATFDGNTLDVAGQANAKGGSQNGGIASFATNPDAADKQGKTICFQIAAVSPSGTSAYSSPTCTTYRYYSDGIIITNSTNTSNLKLNLP
jgi:hypothetical protein